MIDTHDDKATLMNIAREYLGCLKGSLLACELTYVTNNSLNFAAKQELELKMANLNLKIHSIERQLHECSATWEETKNV